MKKIVAIKPEGLISTYKDIANRYKDIATRERQLSNDLRYIRNIRSYTYRPALEEETTFKGKVFNCLCCVFCCPIFMINIELNKLDEALSAMENNIV